MRHVVLSMNTTVNGKTDDLSDWFDGMADDLFAETNRRLADFDTVLIGRRSYSDMSSYWPGAETEEGGSALLKGVARKMNTYQKLVVSSAPPDEPLTWSNAEWLKAGSDQELVASVDALKREPGRDIFLAGGAGLAASMAGLGLINEYRLMVHPTVVPGTAWFDQIKDQRGLELVSATPYEKGVVALCYLAR